MLLTFVNMTTAGTVVTTCCVILLVWEIIAVISGSRRALLSTVFQKVGFRAPGIVFCVGALVGHFWMYFPPTIDGESVTCPQCHQQLELTISNDGAITAALQ